jgi:DNA (cytosine-5)-methyltransferase 1
LYIMPGLDTGYVSFFSGALGLDLGLEQAGLTPLAVNEIDRSAQATIRANRPDLPLLAQDVRELDAATVLAAVGRRPFVVVGGPPCQAFSTAGRRRSLADDRGNVFLHFIDLAVRLEPRFIVIENVRGLLSAPLCHRPHAERGSGSRPLSAEEAPGGALREILAMLEAAGYAASFELYNVANFGVPQSRERLVIIASADGRAVPHLRPTHSENGLGGLQQWQTFEDAVRGLASMGPCAQFRRGRGKYFALIKHGENWRSLPEHLQREALGNAFHSTGGRVGFCRRIAWCRPSPTLVTCPTMPATELAHPEEMRPLSVNEYKRLQTFPDEWIVEGNLAAQYRQIGNAVPVQFARAIGEHLFAHAEGRLSQTAAPASHSRYLGTDEHSWRRRMA